MKRKLSAKERTVLIAKHKKEKNKKICDRIKAVLAYDDGYSYSEIARLLLLDDETIRRHIEDYFNKQKLKPESGGSDSYLNVQQAQALKQHLREKTYLYVKDICHYVKQEFNTVYSISGMTKWLKANGFCYKKPHAVPAKADKEKQAQFIEHYTKLKEDAGNKEVIYFSDSTHPQHQTHLAYGWILKGERKNIATTARQKRVNYIGAVTLNGHKIVYNQVEKVDGANIKNFMNALRRRHPNNEKIHMIWDNASYHRSKEVKSEAERLNIKLHYLPPYSPNLNPIERLWKVMHEHVSYNTYYEKFSDFVEATANFFRHIGKKKKLLRSRITDNFQIIEPPKFAF